MNNYNQKLFESIAYKGHDDLLHEVRTEIQTYLDTVYIKVKEGKFSLAQEKLIQKHLFPLLSSLVFFVQVLFT